MAAGGRFGGGGEIQVDFEVEKLPFVTAQQVNCFCTLTLKLFDVLNF